MGTMWRVYLNRKWREKSSFRITPPGELLGENLRGRRGPKRINSPGGVIQKNPVSFNFFVLKFRRFSWSLALATAILDCNILLDTISISKKRCRNGATAVLTNNTVGPMCTKITVGVRGLIWGGAYSRGLLLHISPAIPVTENLPRKSAKCTKI